MNIQWYPGHMYKASKEIKKVLPKVGLVIEIVDARIPFSSANPMLAELRADKPCIKVLSKSDLADPAVTAQWQTYLEQEQGVKSLALTTEQPDKIKQLPVLCRKILGIQEESIKTLHTLIVGIPNVGKSTLINILAGKAIAKTGDEPAVTKMQQKVNLAGNMVLSDTPGVLWPNVENASSGYRLATTGAIKDTAMEYEDVALFAVDYVSGTYPEKITSRYQIDRLPPSGLEILDMIGRKRGCLRAGAQVDYNRVGKLFLHELRAGLLGPISLETPDMMHQELEELVLIREQKAAKKAARKQRGRVSR